MSIHPRPSMVRTLRRRLLLVVAIAGVVLAVASVWGLRIVTLRAADRQVQVTAQTVASWAEPDGGERAISGERLAAADAGTTIVALIDSDGRVVAASEAPAPIGVLEDTVVRLRDADTVRADVGGRTMLFTVVELPSGTVFDDDDSRRPVSAALVGVGVEAADVLIQALAVAALVLLMLVLAITGVVVTIVVSRTTRSLTTLAERVDRGELDDLATSPAADFAETEGIATAIEGLDARRGETERQLRDFVADVSHELRTPLTKIQGWSQLHFQRPDDPATADDAFASIVEESERMRTLVDRLALLARSEAAVQVREPVDLASVCRSAAGDAALLAPEASVTVDAPGPAIVVGDPLALDQLVRNLLGNALRHAGPGASITLGAHRAGDAIELVVQDDGVGMSPELRERAFERFVSGDRRDGSGLGLAIVQAIAVSHGGYAALDSEPGEGTRVTVSLPSAMP
ncbi:HAMP domain-containing sensor histidine kinase [Homoserinibacter sp. GY 40078]|uniref:sensor histidine kinase n=1 Tax=Homoserinibacter sp. GY 40078 TaxID=2603275 RepID=UPI0011CA6892|nr:HAMP domain-containing sensor histidine kinase [Homoserinibacter sp. GY 40078]TXK16363.1 HAMP domain-containing histidine kinase [Homoserinibacter sp. GY 40078]